MSTDVPAEQGVSVPTPPSLRWGMAAAAIGLLLLLVGGLLVVGQQVVQVVAGPGRARVGNSVTFEAEDRGYAITVIPDPTTGDYVESRVAQLDCVVEHPDGTSETLDASSAAVRPSTPIGVFAVSFQGRPGPTTVTCEWGGTSDLSGSYAVGSTKSSVKIAGLVALVAGVVVGLAGVAGSVIGVRGRSELQDLPPPEGPRFGDFVDETTRDQKDTP